MDKNNLIEKIYDLLDYYLDQLNSSSAQVRNESCSRIAALGQVLDIIYKNKIVL